MPVEIRINAIVLRGRIAFAGIFASCFCAVVLADTAKFSNIPVGGQQSGEAYTFTTFAGVPAAGSSDGAGSLAHFSFPWGVAVDDDGSVFVSDSNNSTIRKITPEGIVTTIAGLAGNKGSVDGTNNTARFFYPAGIAFDPVGNLYVADRMNNTIRQLTAISTNWVVRTIAGAPGFANLGTNDGAGNMARFRGPTGIAVGKGGNLYVTDADNHTIRKIAPAGTEWVVSTVAGQPGLRGTNDGTGTARFNRPAAIAVDRDENLYVADSLNSTLRIVSPLKSGWFVSTIAGRPDRPGHDDGTNSVALFGGFAGIARFEEFSDGLRGIALSTNGNLLVADTLNNTIREARIIGTNYVLSTIAGRAETNGTIDATGIDARFDHPHGVAVDNRGSIYVADALNNTIRKINPLRVVSTIAGSASSSGTADGTGAAARFNHPQSVALDHAGNFLVADSQNHTIRRITSAEVVSTLAGLAGSSGTNDGPGTRARFSAPSSIAIDNDNNIYVADSANHTIRKVTGEGLVTTLAGSPGISDHQDGIGSAARFDHPASVAIDREGSLFVADNSRTVRKLTPQGMNWVVTTIAGSAGESGSRDGTNNTARFADPRSVTVDPMGNVFVVDYDNYTIRKITRLGTNWVVTTVAGQTGQNGHADGDARKALFKELSDITTDSAGNLYVTQDRSVRKIAPRGTNWVVSTIGGGSELGETDGTGGDARFFGASGITVDQDGVIYLADTYNNTIRKGTFTQFLPKNIGADTPAPTVGALMVTLLPSEANGQWHFPWELNWRRSGSIMSNLVTGNYSVEFRNIPGWVPIPPVLPPVQVTEGTTTTIQTNAYFPTVSGMSTNRDAGSLTVDLGATPPNGAGWRFLGDATDFLPSGFTTNLLAGTYLIEFAVVTGRVTPPTQAVNIYAGLPTVISENYLLPQTAPAAALLPKPVPRESITNLAAFPFGFNGQLKSDLGFGSGVAVQQNVVLTAAHLLFDDRNLAYVNQVYWFHQKGARLIEPMPLAARGWYILSGYAAQRTNDIQSGLYAPTQSTPQSRNLDVAAVYFASAVAGGSYGGYLPSDTRPNIWLTRTSLKMLVGYPIDGSLFGDNSVAPGILYQTEPQRDPLNISNETVDNQQVYSARWFFSYPGNSGGPFYVQLNDYYYPAGVYLGTLYNGTQPYASLVRAIDSEVVNLITLAQKNGDNGTNSTGGGVITIIANQAANGSRIGYVQCRQLGPQSALQAGGGWRVRKSAESPYASASNSVELVDLSMDTVIEFKVIPGWDLPAPTNLVVAAGQITTFSAFYTLIRPILKVGRRGDQLEISWSPAAAAFRLESTRNLSHPEWQAVNASVLPQADSASVLVQRSLEQSYYRLSANSE